MQDVICSGQVIEKEMRSFQPVTDHFSSKALCVTHEGFILLLMRSAKAKMKISENDTPIQCLTQPQLFLDLGHTWGKTGRIYLGSEWRYSKNVAGIKGWKSLSCRLSCCLVSEESRSIFHSIGFPALFIFRYLWIS